MRETGTGLSRGLEDDLDIEMWSAVVEVGFPIAGGGLFS